MAAGIYLAVVSAEVCHIVSERYTGPISDPTQEWQRVKKTARPRSTRGEPKRGATTRSGRRPAASIQFTSLTEKAYIALEEMIVTLRLPPGAVLSEAMLSEMIGIGRTPIREALLRLARERLVLVLPQRGIIVSDVNPIAQLRLLEVRRGLEQLVARSAARRASPEERRRFAEIADGLEKASRANNEKDFMGFDREFNMLSASAARNEFLSNAMSLTHALSRRFWFIHYKQVGDMQLAAKLHADIARAISSGDVAKAAAASDRLLDYLEAFTRATVTADTQAGASL